jgi:hypothetical protein
MDVRRSKIRRLFHFDTTTRRTERKDTRKRLNTLIKQGFVPNKDTLCCRLARSRTWLHSFSSHACNVGVRKRTPAKLF